MLINRKGIHRKYRCVVLITPTPLTFYLTIDIQNVGRAGANTLIQAFLRVLSISRTIPSAGGDNNSGTGVLNHTSTWVAATDQWAAAP